LEIGFSGWSLATNKQAQHRAHGRAISGKYLLLLALGAAAAGCTSPPVEVKPAIHAEAAKDSKPSNAQNGVRITRDGGTITIEANNGTGIDRCILVEGESGMNINNNYGNDKGQHASTMTMTYGDGCNQSQNSNNSNVNGHGSSFKAVGKENGHVQVFYNGKMVFDTEFNVDGGAAQDSSRNVKPQ